jgi:hypothetical protein
MKLLFILVCLIPIIGNSAEIHSEAERLVLVDQIITNGKEVYTKTNFPFGSVLNDNLKLEDGTYLPFTIIDARKIAKKWNCRIPTFEELKLIAKVASSNGTQFSAQTYLPNNRKERYVNSNKMMNSPEMHRSSSVGHSQLVDGHFKWYTNKGKIYGFAKGDGTFYHNWPSGRHIKDQSYFDYSHGVRLVCPD